MRVRVREIMSSPAVSVPSTATVREAAATMVAHRINSVVVVDPGGSPPVLGLLTEEEVELAETVVPFAVPSVRAVRLMDLWAQDAEQLDEALREIAGRSVADVMRSPVETVEPDVEVYAAMSRMARLGITRMPVVEDGGLIGLVARHDIMKIIAGRAGP
ncbi:MAG TPA: CBS domain-containing protein [Miltoncostaeaceae bacterium]|jgi:CBS domain-containing protein|nr:CBS domain-containing protein [Miltoncostaeaceae bacterium]